MTEYDRIVRRQQLVACAGKKAITSVANTSGADLILLRERKPGRWHWLSEGVVSEARRYTDSPIQTVSDKVAAAFTRRAVTHWTDTTTADGR